MGQLGTDKQREGSGYLSIGEVDGIEGATDLDADHFNACAVDAGRVICWRAPLFRAPGPGRPLSQPPTRVRGIGGATRVSLSPSFGYAVAGGKVLCWGQEEYRGAPIIEGVTPTSRVPVPGLP